MTKEGEFMWILKAECRHILQSMFFRAATAVVLVLILFYAFSPGSMFLPGIGNGGGESLFISRFGPNALAPGGVFFLLLTGIAVGRSLGGSLHDRMPQMQYTGKFGRKLVLYKILAVCVVSGAVYLAGGLFITLVSLPRFRIDVYWNASLDSMIPPEWKTKMEIKVPEFPVTVGQFWWFQLAVGLAAVVIMAVLFSAVVLLVKNLYAGAAGMLCMYQLLTFFSTNNNPGLFIESPVRLFLDASDIPQGLNLFPILPWFEGGSLLFWSGVAAVLAVLGFMRFRKSAL